MISRRAGITAVGLLCAVAAAAAIGGSGSPQPTQLTKLAPPPDGQSYFGFTFRLWDTSDPEYGDTRPFATRYQDAVQHELGSKLPTFLAVPVSWGDAFNDPDDNLDEALNAESPAGLLYVDWSLSDTTAQNGGPTIKDVEGGSQDAYVTAFAEAAADYAKPVLIRLFGGEFNGSWWWGQSPLANPSLTTADFVGAWRRVVGIFRKVGAKNVSFAWIANAFPPGGQSGIDSNIAAYYPGDDDVDWIGADTYDNGPPSWLDEIYDFATAHGKPFFLAEWGVRDPYTTLTPSEQNTWIGQMFDYVESHQDIKAINYFDYDSRADNGIALDPSKIVSLDGGAVTYQTTNDWDSRLLADDGAGYQSTYAHRIDGAHYVSSIATAAAGAVPRPTATLSVPSVRGLTATVHWRGGPTAASYLVEVRRSATWKLVLSETKRTSLTLRGTHQAQVYVRVAADDAVGDLGPWSKPATIRFH